MFRKLVATPNDPALLVLRLALGIVFFAHGSQKMLGWFGGRGFSATMNGFTHYMGIPAPLAFLAICAEFFGGIGLMVGLLGRIAAFGITVNMVIAALLIHRHYGFFMNWSGTQKGEGLEFFIVTIALGVALIIKGSGALSVDRLLTRPAEADKSALQAA